MAFVPGTDAFLDEFILLLGFFHTVDELVSPLLEDAGEEKEDDAEVAKRNESSRVEALIELLIVRLRFDRFGRRIFDFTHMNLLKGLLHTRYQGRERLRARINMRNAPVCLQKV